MTGKERRGSGDSFDSADWVDSEGEQLSRQTSNSSQFELRAYEQYPGQLGHSNERTLQRYQMGCNRLALPEDWEGRDNKTNYDHSDEGIADHHVMLEDHICRWTANIGHSRRSDPDFTRYVRDLVEPGWPPGQMRVATRSLVRNANVPSGEQTPGSPSSTHVEAGSSNISSTASGHNSMSDSGQLSVPPDRTEDVVVHMEHEDEIPFQATPAATHNWTPLYLGHTLMLGLESMIDDSGYLTGHTPPFN